MILLLNGVSSSGKTALARALQLRWPRPLLHLGTDTVLTMLPASLVGMTASAEAGVQFVEDRDERGPVVRVRSGEVGKRLEASFARAARVMADDGHDLVLDLVLFDPGALTAWARALHSHPTYLIGVHCDPAALEARELAGGDRFQNLARTQLETVHAAHRFYDLDVDTMSRGPQELAGEIVAFVETNLEPSSLERFLTTPAT